MDVAESVIDLVEIILVFVRRSHALQLANHLLRLRASHHLGHGDAGVKLNFVGRILRNHLFIGLVSLLRMSQLRFQLPEQVVFAGFLALSHLVLDDFFQVGHGLGIVARVDVVVGQRVVPFLLRAPVDGVASHVANHVLGVVEPFLLNVALREPCPGASVDGRLRLVEPAHIIKRGGGLVESPFVELRPSHHQPRLPEKRIVFLAREPFEVALRLAAFLRPFGSFFDAV